MKKIFVVVLSLFLLFGVLVVSADIISDIPESYQKVGNALEDLKIIKGDGKGLNENGNLNREEAIVILIRMLGLEEEALKIQPQGIFSDIPAKHWAAKYVEYAYQNGLTGGIGNGKFGKGMIVNKKMAATYMLRALGYSADWSKEDIMAKAGKYNITKDRGEGLEPIKRGQTFIYIANTLLQNMANKEEALLLNIVGKDRTDKYKSFESTMNSVKQTQSSDMENGANSQGNSNQTQKPQDNKKDPVKPVVVKLSNPLIPTGARTYLYDEFVVEFNQVVAQPKKSDFTFEVDGRIIDSNRYTMAPGGKEIRFKFSNQNLHGKTLICRMSGLKGAYGVKLLAPAKISAEFKDFTAIKFVKAQVIDEKSFKGTLSVAVMPPDGHMKGTEGHEVYSDGKLMTPNVDYQLGWGGKEFKVVFKNKDSYPKQNASLKIWGYMTAPYHKFMDDPDEITLDFSIFEQKDIPLPEPKEPAPAVIEIEEPDIRDFVEQWNDVPVTKAEDQGNKPNDDSARKPDNLNDRPVDTPIGVADEPKDTLGEDSNDNPNTVSDYLGDRDSLTPPGTIPGNSYEKQGEPAIILYYDYFVNKLKFYTNKKIRAIEGLTFIDRANKVHDLNYEPFVLNISGKQFTGFTVTIKNPFELNHFDGYLNIDKLIEDEHGLVTGPFRFEMFLVIN